MVKDMVKQLTHYFFVGNCNHVWVGSTHGSTIFL